MKSSNFPGNAKNLALVSDASAEQSQAALQNSRVSACVAAFSVVSDSWRILSAFAWGKEGRLSKKKSAQLCDLMNAWN